jgi:hypothetical protein
MRPRDRHMRVLVRVEADEVVCDRCGAFAPLLSMKLLTLESRLSATWMVTDAAGPIYQPKIAPDTPEVLPVGWFSGPILDKPTDLCGPCQEIVRGALSPNRPT